MILRSLLGRLTLANLCALPLILGATGYALDRAFQNSLLAGERERLQIQVYLLLGAVEIESDAPLLPQSLSEPSFNQLNSGLYAFLTDSGGRELWRSTSASLLPPAATPIAPYTIAMGGGDRKPQFTYSRARGYLALTYPVIWELSQGRELIFEVVVAQNDQLLRASLAAHRGTLRRWLGGLGLLLIVLQRLVLSWGLSPLRRLARDIAGIESGQSDTLTGPYPREVETVTDNLNQLLQSEREQRERYRHTLADLAHSLKTPLAVLHGKLQSEELPRSAQEPISRMADIIQHQLQRAARGSNAHIGRAVPIIGVVNRLNDSLRKVYADSPRSVTIEGDSHAAFRGDERDLMEMLGNLLDNAWKYSSHRILLQVRGLEHGGVAIDIHDDGPGIAIEQREQVLTRGGRGDTSRSGQGIGLAVVADIVSAYGGGLELHRSPRLGGALLILKFKGVL